VEIVPIQWHGLQPVHLIVDGRRDRVIAPYIKKHRMWEPLETSILLRCIEPGYRVVDVGANVGYYTLLFSRLVGKTGKVWAFEPEPANYKLLCASVLINDCTNVVCECKAVAERIGTQSLYLSSFNLGDHRLYPSSGRTACEVETTTLDEYIADQPLDFIKIDTQGSEPRILTGMSGLVENCRTQLGCLIEFSPGLLERSGFGLEAFLALLHSLEARVYWIDVQEKKVELARLEHPEADLHRIAGQMLDTGREDLSRDVLVFFSEEAERRHLRSIQPVE
jgi:FkbM family methyltransferase